VKDKDENQDQTGTISQAEEAADVIIPVSYMLHAANSLSGIGVGMIANAMVLTAKHDKGVRTQIVVVAAIGDAADHLIQASREAGARLLKSDPDGFEGKAWASNNSGDMVEVPIEVPAFENFWHEQGEWSEKTFGPSSQRGPVGPLKHLAKEAEESQIAWRAAEMSKGGQREQAEYAGFEEEMADDLSLVVDAARRGGMTPQRLLEKAMQKLEKNKASQWPDWRTQPADEAIEHDRTGE
jgi:hypothetical protein